MELRCVAGPGCKGAKQETSFKGLGTNVLGGSSVHESGALLYIGEKREGAVSERSTNDGAIPCGYWSRVNSRVGERSIREDARLDEAYSHLGARSRCLRLPVALGEMFRYACGLTPAREPRRGQRAKIVPQRQRQPLSRTGEAAVQPPPKKSKRW